MKLKFIFVILAVALFGGMTFFLIQQSQTRCQLCIEFNQKLQCSEARGPTETEALEEAHRNACAIVASGVTETLACHRVPAQKELCSP